MKNNRFASGFCLIVVILLTLTACGTTTTTTTAAGTTVAETIADVTTAATTIALSGIELSDEMYVDPKGYFKITPPKGWNTEDYPSDPRGKVAFGMTEGDQLVEIRVLVQVTQVTDFQEFVRKLRSNAENLGWQPEWQTVLFSDLPAIRSIMTLSTRGMTNKIMNIRFLNGDIYHDIQFSCPQTLFDKYQDIFSKVATSYEIVKQPSAGESSATAKQHQAAKYLTLAQAAIEIGDNMNAIAFVDEGLKDDPENKDLLRLKESLKK